MTCHRPVYIDNNRFVGNDNEITPEIKDYSVALIRDNQGYDDYMATAPTAYSPRDYYYDDGTNTGSGTRGKRVSPDVVGLRLNGVTLPIGADSP